MKSILKACLTAVPYCIWLLALPSCNTTDTGVSRPFPDCSDGIQNQGEFGIDCGGPCGPCPAKMTAKINGAPWESQGAVTTVVNHTTSSIMFLSGNGTSNLSLIHTGSFTNGTFPLQSAMYTISATQTNFISNSGSITFLDWNKTTHQVFGTFKFTGYESTGTGDSAVVTQGVFQFVDYEP